MFTSMTSWTPGLWIEAKIYLFDKKVLLSFVIKQTAWGKLSWSNGLMELIASYMSQFNSLTKKFNNIKLDWFVCAFTMYGNYQ